MPNFFYNEYRDQLDLFIKNALSEDIRDGDLTGNACIPEGSIKSAKLYVKTPCIIAGIELVEKSFKFYDPSIKFNKLINDGARVDQSSTPFIVEGSTRSILATERLVLNTLQRMSGIASKTNKIVNQIAHTDAKILDTRKTTPGLRKFEKHAVSVGGGWNHRLDLSSAILVKDNHIQAAGNIKNAINQIRKKNIQKLPIELEVDNLDQLKEGLELKVDGFLLDNMTPEIVKKGVELIRKEEEGHLVFIEASGGINIKTLESYAWTGIDGISMSAITANAPAVDIKLEFE